MTPAASTTTASVFRGNAAIVRGGPIYINNYVGPLIGIPEFESTLLHQLDDLKLELCVDSSSFDDDDVDDILVDDLRMFSDEDLVEMALKEPLKDGSSLEPSQKHSNARGENDELRNGGGNFCDATLVDTKKRRCLESTEESQAEEVLKIKQKQDQDKANATLHSLTRNISKTSEETQRMKYLSFTNSGKQLKQPEFIAVQHSDIVLCVEVYHNIQQSTKTQQFLVLGTQPLTELRDKICCTTDQVMQNAGQHDPSGYFLIEDVFCNDTRDPSAIDYTEPIFDWLINSKHEALRKWECIVSGKLQTKQKAVIGEVVQTPPQLPPFRRVEMHKTRFCDLRFRLGAGYLYCHQGDCKHTIVIRDMRLIHPEDLQNRSTYPIRTFQLKLRVQKCNVCKTFRATKVTVDDKWTPYNPCYFCNDCYYLLHYSQNGSLLYSDFSTHDYLHD